MNMIIGKRQIILASLILVLGIAIYLNWQFSSGNDLAVTGQTESNVKNYGDAQYVDNQNGVEEKDAETYFAEAKLSRQKTRDEAVETIQTMISDTSIEEDQKETLSAQASQIASAIETESRIENLIKAKGFADCIAYIDDDKANVIVKTDGLLENEAAQIKEILLQETDVPVENISIVEVK
ncbi:SpoIIIAH-like family protein [Zongyangia hominis]|uniref:SpoIIIAH-like family protein n=1 Tax=Zongyangia hominis TaxID=2763677 RepID=A0A926EAR5_9FIRM|nr:SpoIIIAH-like family protein [Zongyangia hominis]MBC8569603.1 SpoIIIAH-like family protein [Zongyangia hominis]